MDNWMIIVILCSILVLYTIWSMMTVIKLVSSPVDESFLNYTRDIHSRLPGFIKRRVDPDRIEKLNEHPLVKYNPYVYVGKKILDKVVDGGDRALPIIPQPSIQDDGSRPKLPNIPPPPKWLGKIYGK
jgi:hypothetical protein